MWAPPLQGILARTALTEQMLCLPVEPVKTEPMAELTHRVARPGKQVATQLAAYLAILVQTASTAQLALMALLVVQAVLVILV